MTDIERLIQLKIERSKRYRHPSVISIVRQHHEIQITVLQEAPRNELELAKMVEQKNKEIDAIPTVVDSEPLRSELEALQWLYSLLRLASVRELTDDSIV